MADKDIQIKIAATGGDQAAGEVRKVEDAAKAAQAATKGSEGGFAPNGFGSGQLDSQAGATERLAEAVNKLKEAEGSADDVVRKSTASLEEKFEAIDKNIDALEEEAKAQAKANAAEETAANTRAIRNRQLLEQVSRLGERLERFGSEIGGAAENVEKFDPALADMLRTVGKASDVTGGFISSIATGAAVAGPFGAVVAGAAESAKYFATEMGDAAAEAAAFGARSTQAFDALIDRLGKVAAAKDAAEFESFLTGLKSEEAAISNQNEALVRNVQLLEARKAAEEKLETARARNEISKIDADPALSDAEKIQRKAGVTEALERKRLADRLNGEGRDVNAAENDAKAKADAAARATADAEAVRQRKEADDAERTDLERREKARDLAQAQLPNAEASAAAARKKAELLRRVPFLTGPQEDAEAQQQRLEDLRNQASANPQDSKRLAILKANEAKVAAAAEKAEKEAEKSREEAEKAKLDAENKRRIFQETTPLAVATYQEERAGRGTQTAAAVAAAEKRAADEKKRADDRAQRKADRNELEKRKAALEETARGNESRITLSGNPNKALKSLADDIGRADTESEIRRVGDAITAKQSELGATTVQALKRMLAEQEKQAKEIATLTKQFKNR